MKNSVVKLASLVGILSIFSMLKTKVKNPIIIGDSQTFLISQMTDKITLKDNLCRNGWNVGNLIFALNSNPIDKTVSEVFICIGTNGNFSKNDNIEQLVALVKNKFPNARLYAIVGSYGWGNNAVVGSLYTYYLRFFNKGVIVLKTQIGNTSTHPTTSTPSIKKIAEEINSILN